MLKGLRQLAKTALASGLHRTGIDAWLGEVSGAGRRPLVLGYHRVVPALDAATARTLPGMVVTLPTLERHLDWIGRRCRFVPLDELGRRMEAGLAAGLAAVTFDDGYRDVFEHALPLLRRRGIPAAVFVVTELVDSGEPPIHDRLYLLLRAVLAGRRGIRRLAGRLETSGVDVPRSCLRAAERGPLPALRSLLGALSRAQIQRVVESLESEVEIDQGLLDSLRPLSLDQLRALVAAGVTIGSHTHRHALLTGEDAASLEEETAGSRRALEGHLGTSVAHFAYPDGRWDDRAVAAVTAAGYRYAYTICPHRHPLRRQLTIPRTMLWEGSCLDAAGRFSEAVLSCHAHGLFDLIPRCRPLHPAPHPAAP